MRAISNSARALATQVALYGPALTALLRGQDSLRLVKYAWPGHGPGRCERVKGLGTGFRHAALVRSRLRCEHKLV